MIVLTKKDKKDKNVLKMFQFYSNLRLLFLKKDLTVIIIVLNMEKIYPYLMDGTFCHFLDITNIYVQFTTIPLNPK